MLRVLLPGACSGPPRANDNSPVVPHSGSERRLVSPQKFALLPSETKVSLMRLESCGWIGHRKIFQSFSFRRRC